MSSADPWRIDRGDSGYPGCLAHLRRAPRALHGVGDRSLVAGLDHEATVTIVGSRRASSYGLRVAEGLGRDLASAGATVVSGMAWGIDSAAHRGALAGGGATIAVLAGGPDVVYPPSARGLYGEIAAAGAVIAEHEPGTPPARWAFTERNRIMAALARYVVVVEAAQPSGSLVTAREAIDLGREVGAVPGQVGMLSAAGTNQLIADGAAVVRFAEDVLDRLAGVGGAIRRPEGPALDPDLARVLELVESGVVTADGVAAAGGLDPHRAGVALTRLELLGYLASGATGSYARTTMATPSG